MFENNVTPEQVEAWARRLMATPSVSPDVEAENRCAETILELLATAPFQNSLQVETWPCPDGRRCVVALLEGTHPANIGETVVLMGHYDTVGVEEFGRLRGTATAAFEPDEVRDLLLSARGSAKIPEAVVAHLAEQWLPSESSGERPAWLFGRGGLDMKIGIAACLAVLSGWVSRRDQLAGNLLFLACPDEENSSLGVRSAVPRLEALKKERAWGPFTILNSDYFSSDAGAPPGERSIYRGTIGKILPSVYVLGTAAHVGDPFGGVDAIHLARFILEEIHLSMELQDLWRPVGETSAEAETAPPPVALYCRDLKTRYNVETVSAAFLYFNWLLLGKSPEQALIEFRETLETALGRALARHTELAASSSGRTHQCPVLTFDQVKSEALASGAGAEWERELGRIFEGETDPRLGSLRVVEETCRLAGVAGPAAILFLSPPFYPAAVPRPGRLEDALRVVLETAATEGPLASALDAAGVESLRVRAFYPFISDLSFVAGGVKAPSLALAANAPDPRLLDPVLDVARIFDAEVVNIGPWGFDAHGLFERAHLPYACRVLPEILTLTVRELIGR